MPTCTAQIRVTPEETGALSELEADKKEAMCHRESTISIGIVVSEMNLEGMPDEVWAQGQKQRSGMRPFLGTMT